MSEVHDNLCSSVATLDLCRMQEDEMKKIMDDRRREKEAEKQARFIINLILASVL
jgi:hypothetical protein